MQTSITLADRTTRGTRWVAACAAALALTFAGWPPSARGDGVTPPPVPANLQVPAGNTAFLVGHAVGTQGYICQPSATGFAWTFVKPQATLFNEPTPGLYYEQQIITHFLSPNLGPISPEVSGTPRPTWQDSHDTSRVWGKAIQTSSDPAFVASGAIPWLLLQVVGSQPGPTGGTTLTATTYLQRLNTTGGVAPTTGCAQATDVGAKALVPYTADYFFYQVFSDRPGTH